MKNEPLLTVGTITTLVAALITLAAAFGLPLTPDQTDAILGFVAVAAPIAVALVARRYVSPSWKVVESKRK